MKNADGTASLEKAIDVLEAIGSAPEGLSQTQLSERVTLPRTTMYRIIATLVARGMVRRDPFRKVYRLGFRYLEMVRNAYLMPDLVAAASSELRALRDLTGETSYLAMLDGNQVLSLERCDGAHSHRSNAAIGQSKPVYCTSQGKAILSALDDIARQDILKGVTLTPLTPLTITDKRRLLTELQITSVRGYAIDDEEIALGIRCVGAPIIDPAGNVRGALSVAGPAYRLTRARLDLLGPEVADAARRVGAQLSVHTQRNIDSPAVAIDAPWAFHGAFPRWSAQRQCLYWADTLAPAVRVYDGKKDRTLASLEAPIEVMELWDDGLLLRSGTQWLRLDDKGTAQPVPAWPNESVKALCFSPDRRLWLCLADADNAGFRVGVFDFLQGFMPGWHLSEEVTALCWDTHGQALYAVAPDSGTIFLLHEGNAQIRRFASLPKGSGELSGLTLDKEGGVWTALKDGWSVVRFASDGTLDQVIGLPVPRPTDLTWGGENADILFITSERQAVPIEVLNNAPLSGNLFITTLSKL